MLASTRASTAPSSRAAIAARRAAGVSACPDAASKIARRSLSPSAWRNSSSANEVIVYGYGRDAVWWSTSVTRAFWKLEITAALSSRKARSRQSVASLEVSRPSASAIASARS